MSSQVAFNVTRDNHIDFTSLKNKPIKNVYRYIEIHYITIQSRAICYLSLIHDLFFLPISTT